MAIPKRKPKEPESTSERDPDQAWFWTEEWQQGEKEVEEHIHRGEVETFDSMDEFLASLDDPELRMEMKALEEAGIEDLLGWETRSDGS
jgi:hypothetical protein